MQQRGAQIVMDVLREQGTQLVFGYPGGAVLELYDALHSAGDIRHILTAHEQAAAHAADGYARASGKTGVVFATSGPGATNLVTGIAAAHMDSSPLVAITGNVRTGLLGSDAFQEVDIAGVTMPLTKYSFIVRGADTLAADLREAFQIAQSGRKGPVLVDLPMDVSAQQADFQPVESTNAAVCDLDISVQTTQIVQTVAQAKRPLLLVGGGAADAARELRELALGQGIPVVCTLMGLGIFPASHPQFWGMAGIHGTAQANAAIRKCDLLLAVGTRFSDRVTQGGNLLSPQSKCIHMDIDEAELHKNIPADISVCADAARVLRELCDHMPQRNTAMKGDSLWQPPVDISAVPCADTAIPAQLLHILRTLCEEDTVIVTDVGQHQLWAARYFPVEKPRSFLTSGGLGAMGFGMGAAIGASLACPGKRVVLITGDGSFHMNCAELATLRSYRLPISVFIFNNNALGLVRQWQTQSYGRRYSQSEPGRSTDFVRLAEAFGVKGLRLCDPSQAQFLFREALSCAEPVVVDCPIPQDAMI